MANIFDSASRKNSVIIDRRVFDPQHAPSALNHRDEQIRAMVLNLADALEGHIPGNMILFGPSGVGKTAASRFVAQQLEERAQIIGSSIYTHEINCQHVNTRYRVLHGIAEGLQQPGDQIIPFTGWPADRVLSEAIRRMDRQGGVHILILDEMDQLASRSEDQLLYDLTSLNVLLRESRASIIGISNDIGFTERIPGPIRSRLSAEDIIFTPYGSDQIADILEDRAKIGLRQGSWDEVTIRFCADLSAKEHGDARRAIDLLRVSTLRAESAKSNSIEIEHVQSAHKQVEHERVIALLQGLPLHQKLTMTSIIINERNGVLTQTTGTIWETYTQACRFAGMKPLTSRSLSSIINSFHSASLAHVKNVSLGRRGRTKHVSSLIPRGLDAIRIMCEVDETIKLVANGTYKLQRRL
ncbi:MAG TPA: AAA family ATPase [Candidatus Thalassarchaeaceae archaeon]|nr:AAA family ATPase [Candidatus Thalassarchaeaceae archaeon]